MSKSVTPLKDMTQAIKDGTHGTHRRVKTGVPLLSAKNITESGTLYFDARDERITDSEYQSIDSPFPLQTGDVLLTVVGSLGRRAVFAGEHVCFQRSVAFVRPDPRRCDSRYLYHCFGHSDFQRQLVARSNATAQAGIYLGELGKTVVPAPPIDEQRRIAAILDASEATIRATEAVIEKLRLDLAGLRTEIFAANQAWTTCLFGETIRSFIDYRGRTPKKLGMNWGGGEIPALSAMNVSMGKIDLSKETYYGTDALYRRWMTNGDAEQGDVLLTMEAPLGNVAQIPDARKYILSQRVLLLKFDKQRFDNDFMRQLMTDYQFQSAMLKWSTGTTAVGIQRARLVLIPIKTPALTEQVKLAATLLACEHRITAGELELAKLRLQHQGLLHDLLTGMVHVSDSAA